MAVRAYGRSLATYNSWVTLTSYVLTNRVIPTTYNGKSYECTTAGTSGLDEPTWNTELDSTIDDGTIVWTCQDYESIPAALTVMLDTSGQGNPPLKDVWVKSDSPAEAEFIIEGSYDGENWRRLDEMSLPHSSGRDNRHKGLENAYRFIRVSTETVASNEIEIVAGG
ncbi:hypothetical protein LCGC14_0839890 [marine sediment metagenome]|uniref:Uncharacterized protein n=1 Tax=marine sediment metagenome TaxID=412755 RepID=A0A0F9PDI9_9ZZZZ